MHNLLGVNCLLAQSRDAHNTTLVLLQFVNLYWLLKETNILNIIIITFNLKWTQLQPSQSILRRSFLCLCKFAFPPDECIAYTIYSVSGRSVSLLHILNAQFPYFTSFFDSMNAAKRRVFGQQLSVHSKAIDNLDETADVYGSTQRTILL